MKPGFLVTCLFSIFSLGTCAQSATPADSLDILTDSTGTIIHEKVEIEASFAGGDMSWRKFLGQKLNPNVPVDNGAPIGKYTVFVQFVVDKTGNIRDVKALTKHGFGMEEEVLRLIKAGPKWEPALQKGKPVNAYRKQPVTFMVIDDDIEISSKEEYVFYTGIDNTVNIKVSKLKPDDISVTISQGNIVSNTNGNYIVKVNRVGKAVISIYNAKKGNKLTGAVNFEVKQLPKPTTQ